MTDQPAASGSTHASRHTYPHANRTVGVLAFGQALSMTGAGIVILVTGLAGAYLAEDDRLATLPLAIQFVATMTATFPAALWMKHVGRRIGFYGGTNDRGVRRRSQLFRFARGPV